MVFREAKHGRFNADLAGTGVEDEVDAISQALGNMCGRGGGQAHEEVGAGGGDGQAGLLDQGESHGVIGHAQAYGCEAGGEGQRDGVRFW